MKYIKGMETSLGEYKNFPTLEDIKNDYSTWRELTKDIRTIEQVRELIEKGYGDNILINQMELDEYVKNGGTNENIKEIIYGHFGCLDCICDEFGKEPIFDVYSELYEYDFIVHTTIDQVEEKYEPGIREALETGIRLYPERFTSDIVRDVKAVLGNQNDCLEANDDIERQKKEENSMIFNSVNDMTMYMEENYFGNSSNHDVIYAYLPTVIDNIKTIAIDALENWLKETGYSREKYIVDDKAYFSKIEEKAKLCLENYMLNHKYSIALAFTRVNYDAPVADDYDKGHWLKDYSEEDLAQAAMKYAANYCHASRFEIKDQLRLVCDRALRYDPPKLYTKEYLAQQEANKVVVNSYLDIREEGKTYPQIENWDMDKDLYAKATAWLAETDPNKLYEAVLFSNKHLNIGCGLFALQNVARNPHTPPDALWLIARGDLDNQGENMMTNEDVKTLWSSILENPNCPPTLMLDIAMEASLSKSVMPMERAAYIIAAWKDYTKGNDHLLTKQLSPLFADYLNQIIDNSEFSQHLAEALVEAGIRANAQKELSEYMNEVKDSPDREELPGHVIE